MQPQHSPYGVGVVIAGRCKVEAIAPGLLKGTQNKCSCQRVQHRDRSAWHGRAVLGSCQITWSANYIQAFPPPLILLADRHRALLELEKVF